MPTLSDNKTEFIINSDSIFINNRNDNHNEHIVIRTKGQLDDNDVQFENCNVKLNQGHLSCQEYIDTSGNTLMSFSENTINFHNKTIQNLNISTGGLSASSVASANGYTSLDAELDAHLLLINGKISQTGHTASKVFVSSGGGAFVTSADCVAGDLAKIGSGGAVDSNTAKSSFPGFGTSASTALVGNTTTISAGQASAITANTAKTSFPGFGTSASTALVGNTTTISAGQASAITTNTAKTSFPGFGTSASTALVGNTTTISAGQASAISANTAKTSFPGFGTSASTVLAGNTTTISSSQASAISANTAKTSFPGFGTSASTALAGNTTTISSSQATAITNNSSNISANTSNINTNSSNISTNATDITALNAYRVADSYAIGINATNITNAKAKTDKITITQFVNLDNIKSATSRQSLSGNTTVFSNNVDDIIVAMDTTEGNSKCKITGGSTGSPADVGYLLRPAPDENYWYMGTDATEHLFFVNSTNEAITHLDSRVMEMKTGGDIHIKGGQFLLENSGDSDHQLIISRPASGYARIQTIEQGVGYNQVLSLQANDGKVAIGATSASEAKLHVNGYVTKSISGGRRIWAGATSVVTFTATNYNISIYASHDIRTAGNVFVGSDRRIKENIFDVSDNKALNMLREIPCRYYEYKDKYTKGNEKTIGFIAQEVKEVLPVAVATHPAIIPNELRLLENISWNGNKMSSTDLQDVSGIKYRFYVGNDISDNEKIVDLVGDKDNCFTFEQEWEIVYCYGKEVDDFHALDKSKLFALNFSATQELDKLVAKLTDRIKVLEEKLK